MPLTYLRLFWYCFGVNPSSLRLKVFRMNFNVHNLDQHSGHAYITMPIILLIIYIFQNSINNISKISNPILIKLCSLDSPHGDESNGGIFINFGSLDANIFTILYFYYELSHYIKLADSAWLCWYTFSQAIKIDKFKFFNYVE